MSGVADALDGPELDAASLPHLLTEEAAADRLDAAGVRDSGYHHHVAWGVPCSQKEHVYEQWKCHGHEVEYEFAWILIQCQSQCQWQVEWWNGYEQRQESEEQPHARMNGVSMSCGLRYHYFLKKMMMKHAGFEEELHDAFVCTIAAVAGAVVVEFAPHLQPHVQ